MYLKVAMLKLIRLMNSHLSRTNQIHKKKTRYPLNAINQLSARVVDEIDISCSRERGVATNLSAVFLISTNVGGNKFDLVLRLHHARCLSVYVD